mgnify:CR=1 FL=1
MPVTESNKRRTRLWAGIGVGAVALVGAAYVTAHFVAGDQVPAHATVGDVAIGGMSPDEAEQQLRDALGDTYTRPITLQAGERSATLQPEKAGLTVDYAATIDQAGGGASWNPVAIYRSLTGGDDVELVFDVDDDALREAVAGTQQSFSAAPKDATIALKDGKVVQTKAEQGSSLRVDETADKVDEAFRAARTDVEADVEITQPAVGDDVVQAFRDGALAQALDGPVSLTSKNGNVELPQATVAKALTITGKGKDLAVAVDEKAFDELTGKDRKRLNANGPKDASYRFQGGKVVVVPSKPGVVIEQKDLRAAFTTAVQGKQRTVAIKGKEKEPEFSTAKAEQLKPKEVIGAYSTQYPHASYRNTNIGQAAKRVNGSVLLPGETFSLNDTVGERTAANGFAGGYVINGGALVKELGGGVSQAATTLFNAAFFAGFEDVEHKPHSLYFSRYPAGREATVYYGSVDLRFKNNTKYPAIIQGFIDPSSGGKRGTVTFRVWSTKTWDRIESSELVKSDYYSGGTRVSTAHNCEPQSAQQGFTVNYKRLFYKGGKVVKSEPFRWQYNAGDRIVCE